MIERVHGEVYLNNDIITMIQNLNANKTKFYFFTLDLIEPNRYEFYIENDDPKNRRNIYKYISNYITQSGKGWIEVL